MKKHAEILVYGLLTTFTLSLSLALCCLLFTTYSSANRTDTTGKSILRASDSIPLYAIQARVTASRLCEKRPFSFLSLSIAGQEMPSCPTSPFLFRIAIEQEHYDQAYLRKILFPFLWFG